MGEAMAPANPESSGPWLEDLRPLMLVEVTRKIWVGLIMGRIANFWRKSALIDDAQMPTFVGKGFTRRFLSYPTVLKQPAITKQTYTSAPGI